MATLASAQAPDGINYQAVVRNSSGTILTSQTVGMQISILQTSPTGTVVYQETFGPTTNAYGLVNLVIGQGTPVTGDFTTIDWASGPYYVEVAADVTGGTSYAVLGTQQLMSVPYALHAETAGNAFSGDYNDLTNQPTIPTNTSDLTNDSGFITNADDADADPTNEFNTGASLAGNTLTIIDGGGGQSVDLSALVDDADADPSNELQSVSISGQDITLSDGGGTVTIPDPVLENTGGRSGLCSGNTAATGWIVNDAFSIYQFVDMSGCGFANTPRIFTSLGGGGSHVTTVGVSAIYFPSTNVFRVYLQKHDGSGITPTEAQSAGWFVNWIAVGN